MMTAQLETSIGQRRINCSLELVDKVIEAMTAEERAVFTSTRTWHCLVILSRLRAMEMGEEAAGFEPHWLADVYDRLITPGEPLLEALLRTYQSLFGGEIALQASPELGEVGL